MVFALFADGLANLLPWTGKVGLCLCLAFNGVAVTAVS